MDNLKSFLSNSLSEFSKVSVSLSRILKEEKRIKGDILVEKGFLIKKYSLNYSKLNLSELAKILNELKRIKVIEVQLREQLTQKTNLIKQVEKEYQEITKKKLHTNLLPQLLKEVLHYSDLLTTRTKQLKNMLEEGLKLHKKSLPKNTEIFFASFEHVANKIMRFIYFLEQLTKKILTFEKEAYYSAPKTYGRAMASREFKKTISLNCLSSGKDPVPVFDAPTSVREKIKSMSKDQLKNFFAQIGVIGGFNVIFFRTKVKPFNHDHPIPQSNGLREYKFPKGMNVEVLAAA